MTVPAANNVPSFLAFLRESCDKAPVAVTKIVDKSIEIHNFQQTLRYYEIRNPELAGNILRTIVHAVSEKMDADVRASVVGAETFTKIVMNAVAFALVAGAHLAKEREL